MKLNQLRHLVTLAETGNFRRAAERLHIAQPPLSVSIRKLEAELGCPLFDRSPGGVRLTVEGQAMLADARLALFHADQCRQAVDEARQGLGGALRLGFIGSATHVLLPRWLPLLRERFPSIRLELAEGTTADILADLLAHRLDAGLVRYPLLDPGPFALTPLERDDFALAVSTRNTLAARDAIALAEAADEPFIMYPVEQVPGLAALALLRCQLSGFRPRIEQEARQVQTIMSLVASGLGVGLVASVARQAAPSGVKCLRLTDTPEGFHVGIALVHLGQGAPRLVERVVAHALEVFHRKQLAPA